VLNDPHVQSAALLSSCIKDCLPALILTR